MGSIQYLSDLDMLSFDALTRSASKIHFASKTQEAFMIHVASQGATKDLKKFIRPWQRVAKSNEKKAGDQKDFLKRFGKGI